MSLCQGFDLLLNITNSGTVEPCGVFYGGAHVEMIMMNHDR